MQERRWFLFLTLWNERPFSADGRRAGSRACQFFLFIYIIFIVPASGATETICDLELSKPATVFLRHIKSSVRDGTLPLENLRWMIQQVSPVNPIPGPSSVFNLSLKKGLLRQLNKLSNDDWKLIVAQAKALEQSLQVNVALLTDAQAETRPFFFWRKETLELSGRRLHGTFVSSTGDTFTLVSLESRIVIYDPVQQSEVMTFENTIIPYYSYEWWTYFETSLGAQLLALTTNWSLTIIDLSKREVVQKFDFTQLPMLREAHKKWLTESDGPHAYPLFNAQFFEKDGDLGVVVGYEGFRTVNTPRVDLSLTPIGIFNLTRHTAREFYAPAGALGFAKLSNNKIYLYGHAYPSTEANPDLYIHDVLSGEPGNSTQYKIRYPGLDSLEPTPYIDAEGRAQFIYCPYAKEKHFRYCDPDDNKIKIVPNVRSGKPETDVLFYDDPKKLMIASISETRAGYVLIVRGITSQPQSHPIHYARENGQFISSETLTGPFGRLILIWEQNEKSGLLSGIHVYSVSLNQLFFIPLPAGSEFSNASEFHFSPKDNKIRVYLNDKLDSWTLFQLWGLPEG